MNWVIAHSARLGLLRRRQGGNRGKTLSSSSLQVVEHGDRAGNLKIAIHEKKCIEQPVSWEKNSAVESVSGAYDGEVDVVKMRVDAGAKTRQHFQND